MGRGRGSVELKDGVEKADELGSCSFVCKGRSGLGGVDKESGRDIVRLDVSSRECLLSDPPVQFNMIYLCFAFDRREKRKVSEVLFTCQDLLSQYYAPIG